MRNKLYYENRIKKLYSRTSKDNLNIIKKLKRKLRSLAE